MKALGSTWFGGEMVLKWKRTSTKMRKMQITPWNPGIEKPRTNVRELVPRNRRSRGASTKTGTELKTQYCPITSKYNSFMYGIPGPNSTGVVLAVSKVVVWPAKDCCLYKWNRIWYYGTFCYIKNWWKKQSEGPKVSLMMSYRDDVVVS